MSIGLRRLAHWAILQHRPHGLDIVTGRHARRIPPRLTQMNEGNEDGRFPLIYQGLLTFWAFGFEFGCSRLSRQFVLSLILSLVFEESVQGILLYFSELHTDCAVIVKGEHNMRWQLPPRFATNEYPL
jgi:hypothetical protein